MSPWLRLSVLLAACGAAAADDSPSQPGSVQWRCWYDQDVHITCLIDTISHAGLMESLPSPIPSIAQEMRRDYGPGRKFFIHIPLHTRPRDEELVALLARSSVCGSGPECSVEFSMDPPTDDELDALLERELPEPL